MVVALRLNADAVAWGHRSTSLSLGKKVYIKEIIGWLNTYNFSNVKYVNLNKNQNRDNFTLKNKKGGDVLPFFFLKSPWKN